jgi:hypothetical protein
MTDQPILEPIDERHIDFYGDDVLAVLVPVEAEPTIYVPIRPICDYLGLSWSGQRERTMRDPVLSEAVRFVRVTRTNSKGGNPEVLALPLDMLPGWLFGISAARVREALRDKIIRYQRDCFRVLWETFRHDILPPSHGATAIAPVGPSGAELAYEIATAVQHLARQQMELEQRLGGRIDHVDHRVDAVARWAGQMERRVSSLEVHLNAEEQITEAQAGELALAVKAVGQVLSGPDRTKNGYQLVYGELYRRYRISSYKNLPQGKFDEVMAWLHQWHTELTKDETHSG